MASIYGLYDATGNLRYIGKANDPAKRLAGHMRDCRTRDTPVYRWIRKNGRPRMEVLEAECVDWREAERRSIAEARARGDKLLNVADGGDEPHCPMAVRRENGRRSNGPGSYWEKVRTDEYTALIHRAKTLMPNIVKTLEKYGADDGAERIKSKMRNMARAMPEHFSHWAAV